MSNQKHGPVGLALPPDVAELRQQEMLAQQQALQMRAQLGAEIYVGLLRENLDVDELVTSGAGPSNADLQKVAEYSLNAAIVFFTTAGIIRRTEPAGGLIQ